VVYAPLTTVSWTIPIPKKVSLTTTTTTPARYYSGFDYKNDIDKPLDEYPTPASALNVSLDPSVPQQATSATDTAIPDIRLFIPPSSNSMP
jgi:hypothetical protein